MKVTKQNLKEFLVSHRKRDVVQCGDFEIEIQSMTVQQQLEVEKFSKDKDSNEKLVLHMLAVSCVDGEGNPLFDSTEEVKTVPSEVAIRIFEKCLAINGIGPDELNVKAKN